MVIVVDTNVFVGACLGVGASNEVVAACLRGTHRALMGAALLDEYEAVLGRGSLFARSRLTAVERGELLDIFLAGCLWTRIYFGWRPNLRDEADACPQAPSKKDIEQLATLDSRQAAAREQ